MKEIFVGFVLFNYIKECKFFPNLCRTMQTVLNSVGTAMPSEC